MEELRIEKLKRLLDKRSAKHKGQLIIENGCLNGFYVDSTIDENTEILYINYGMARPLPVNEKDLCKKKCWYKYFAKYGVTEFFFALNRY